MIFSNSNHQGQVELSIHVHIDLFARHRPPKSAEFRLLLKREGFGRRDHLVRRVRRVNPIACLNHVLHHRVPPLPKLLRQDEAKDRDAKHRDEMSANSGRVEALSLVRCFRNENVHIHYIQDVDREPHP